jgi:Holliday junction resolvase
MYRTIVSYRKGRRLEWKVREIFRRRGWVVVRAAASKPIDLVCLKRKMGRRSRVVLVECKYGGREVTWKDVKPLLDIAGRVNAKPVLAVQEKYGRVRMVDVEGWEAFRP